MRTQNRTTQFKRDVTLALKRGRNIALLKRVMTNLVEGKPLETKFKDHKLSGNYKDHRECHLEPDWLLIYKLKSKEITFVRTGTHSDLFKK